MLCIKNTIFIYYSFIRNNFIIGIRVVLCLFTVNWFVIATGCQLCTVICCQNNINMSSLPNRKSLKSQEFYRKCIKGERECLHCYCCYWNMFWHFQITMPMLILIYVYQFKIWIWTKYWLISCIPLELDLEDGYLLERYFYVDINCKI